MVLGTSLRSSLLLVFNFWEAENPLFSFSCFQDLPKLQIRQDFNHDGFSSKEGPRSRGITGEGHGGQSGPHGTAWYPGRAMDPTWHHGRKTYAIFFHDFTEAVTEAKTFSYSGRGQILPLRRSEATTGGEIVSSIISTPPWRRGKSLHHHLHQHHQQHHHLHLKIPSSPSLFVVDLNRWIVS